jgi:Na+/H+ antiporter
MSTNVTILVGILFAAIPLIAAAKRANISYPIVLVMGGLVLGFIPGIPRVTLDPNIVLLIFLPPLLYWGTITAPTDVMSANFARIAILAFGLVIISTTAVAVAVHLLVPEMPWPVAFVLGAIISPTDELAAVPVLERFHLPRKLLATVSGESLLNDASALVIYGASMAVVLTGKFNVSTITSQFVVTVFGSTLVGLLAARIAVEIWKRVKYKELQCVVSVTLPFLSYTPAVHFSLSGVLAVVAAGTYANHFTPRLMTPSARTQVVGFWTTVVFIANAVLFMVVGLQLHAVSQAAFRTESWEKVVGEAVVVNVVLIAVRFAFVMIFANWRQGLILGWSGMRGAVSLAAAFAVPLTLPGGGAFPNRDVIVFITFSVILVTLVGGGLTLPMLVRALHIASGEEENDEMRLAIARTSEAALIRVSVLERQGEVTGDFADSLRRRFERRRAASAEHTDSYRAAEDARHVQTERDLIDTQRRELVEMRRRGEIDNVVLRKLLASLDFTAAHYAVSGEDT